MIVKYEELVVQTKEVKVLSRLQVLFNWLILSIGLSTAFIARQLLRNKDIV